MGGIVERGVHELTQSGRNILHAPSAGDAAWRAILREPARLSLLTVGGMMGWVMGKLGSVLKGTLKLTGKALATIPFIPASTTQGVRSEIDGILKA